MRTIILRLEEGDFNKYQVDKWEIEAQNWEDYFAYLYSKKKEVKHE